MSRKKRRLTENSPHSKSQAPGDQARPIEIAGVRLSVFNLVVAIIAVFVTLLTVPQIQRWIDPSSNASNSTAHVQTIPAPPPLPPTPEPGRSRIGIADFEDRSKGKQKGIDPAGYIFIELNKRIKRSSLPIEVYRLRKVVDENTALETGREYGCTLLIWGWYDELTINPQIERIQTTRCGPTEDLKSISLTTQGGLELAITTNLPKQVSYLALVILGVDRYVRNEYSLALRFFNEALEGFNECNGTFDANNAFRLRGDTQRARKELHAAIQDYTCAIQLAPNNPINFYNRGLTFSDIGDSDKATEDFTHAIKLYDSIIKDGNVRYSDLRNLGFAYLNLGENDKAIKVFERASQLQPDRSEAFRDLGYAHRIAGNLDQAIEYLSKAIKINPNDSDAFSNLALAYGEKGDLSAALSAFSKAIEANQEYAPAFRSRGFLWLRLGEYTKAIDDFKRAVEILPEDSVAYRDLGYAYLLDTNYNAAIENLTLAISYNPSDADAYLNRARAYRSIRDYSKAIADFNQAIALSTPNSTIHQHAEKELSELSTNP